MRGVPFTSPRLWSKLYIQWIQIIKIRKGSVCTFEIFNQLGSGSVVFPQKLFNIEAHSNKGIITLAPGGITEDGNFLQPDLFVIG